MRGTLERFALPWRTPETELRSLWALALARPILVPASCQYANLELLYRLLTCQSSYGMNDSIAYHGALSARTFCTLAINVKWRITNREPKGNQSGTLNGDATLHQPEMDIQKSKPPEITKAIGDRELEVSGVHGLGFRIDKGFPCFLGL